MKTEINGYTLYFAILSIFLFVAACGDSQVPLPESPDNKSGKEKSVSAYSGTWEQIGCSDGEGENTPCLIEPYPDGYKRIIEFFDQGRKAYTYTKSIPTEKFVVLVQGDQLCSEFDNTDVCFPLKKKRGIFALLPYAKD